MSLDVGDVFDQLAFQGSTHKDLVNMVATEVCNVKLWPTRSDIGKRVTALVARYGHLGVGSRKRFINDVWRKIVRRERKKAEREGKTLLSHPW